MRGWQREEIGRAGEIRHDPKVAPLGARARPCDGRRVDPAPVSGLDPDDSEAWTVLADWLTEHGDPRGLMLALEASDHDLGQLEDLRRRHLHRYSEALWPVFRVNSEADLRVHVELRWRAGLILSAQPLGPNRTALANLRTQVEGLLASEAAVALAELRGNLIDPRAVVEALVSGPPRPTIRALTLGDYRTPMPDLDRLWSRLPGLRELALLGPKIVIETLATAVPHLTRLQLACELDPSPLRAFRGPTFTNLRALELRLGGDDYFGDKATEPDDLLGPLLTGRATPTLQHLAITGVAFGDRLVAALARCPLLDRLRSLDLSDSQFQPHRHSLLALDRPGLRLRLRGSNLEVDQLDELRERFKARLD